MTITNYPNGISSFGMPLIGMTTGNVWFVDDSGSNGNSGTDKDNPFATIDYAIGRCTANHGDVIIVMPGHTEDIAAAGGIAVDVAGVSIIGLGNGGDRPKITFSETASTMTITAAACTLRNLVFSAIRAEVVTAIAISTAGDYTSFESCEFSENANDGTHNYVNTITLATGANHLSWKDCMFIGADANNDAFITGVTHDGFIVENCIFYENAAQATVVGLITATENITNMRIKNCDFMSQKDGAIAIDLTGATNGGTISRCNFSSLDTDDSTTTAVEATGAHCFECYVAGDASSFGIVGGGAAVHNDGA